MWISLQHPVDSTINFCNACYEMGSFTCDYFKSLDWEKIEGYSDEFKNFCIEFNDLKDNEKGQKIGYFIGKFGVDIFAGGAAMKCVAALKNLKNANKICTLEAIATSQANKETVIASATLHAENRALYFGNVKYNYDAHNKHILGHNDYKINKSIWTHPEPENLLKQYAGTGHCERGLPGTFGYKETVDFGETIGIWVSEDGLQQLSTTRGTIHYGKKGAHIVPIKPVNLLKKLIKTV